MLLNNAPRWSHAAFGIGLLTISCVAIRKQVLFHDGEFQRVAEASGIPEYRQNRREFLPGENVILPDPLFFNDDECLAWWDRKTGFLGDLLLDSGSSL